MSKNFMMGYAIKPYTPTEPTPLGGSAGADKRLSNNVIDDVCATCIAMQDEKGVTELLFTLDLCYIIYSVADPCRRYISERTGVPFERIDLCCTHTHEAPITHTAVPAGKRWIENLKFILADTAEEAIKDLAPVKKAETGKTLCNHLNYVRRYKTEDGGWTGIMVPGTPVEHETEADSMLRVLRFERENKKDVLFINFQVHPSGYYDGNHPNGEKRADVSADFIGVVRRAFCKEGYLPAYFQGAAGNTVFRTRLANEVQRPETCELYGEALSEKIKLALSKLRPIELGDFKFISDTFTLEVDHSGDARKDDAFDIYRLSNECKLDEAKALAKERGFETIYQARNIYTKSQKPLTENITVSGFSFGDVVFALAPCEMFCETGAIIKGSSPFEATFVCELSNGWAPYMPTAYAFPHGAYEVTTCHYVPGTAEVITNHFVKLIKDLKDE